MQALKKIFISCFGEDYSIARLIFLKGFAACYFIAFIVTIDQFKALLGENGLLPVTRFLEAVKFWQAPSIFHFYYSDDFLIALSMVGALISLVLLLGFSEKLPWWSTALLWFLLWVLYLSIVNIGQTFYSFGWESILLEGGFLAIFIGANKNTVPLIMIFLLRWMLFRIEFGAGLIKLRGDECWRDLTCLMYHHETQPMPGPLSWYAHNLPVWFHKFEVAANFFVQLALPIALFWRQPLPAIAGILIISSQLWLVLTGNFSWLNWMTIIVAFSAIPNSFLGKVLKAPKITVDSKLFKGLAITVSVLIVIISYYPAKNMLSKKQAMNASFNRFHIVNTYGAFGSVTKKRYEIVFEGTDESQLTTKTKWKEYEFKGKPGDLSKMPAQYAPYHLRLDWLMWFASFGKERQKHWFMPFVEKLLRGDKEVLKLIKYNPFPGKPPARIRVRYYLYEFTTPEERKATGNWWKRSLEGDYLGPVYLKN